MERLIPAAHPRRSPGTTEEVRSTLSRVEASINVTDSGESEFYMLAALLTVVYCVSVYKSFPRWLDSSWGEGEVLAALLVVVTVFLLASYSYIYIYVVSKVLDSMQI